MMRATIHSNDFNRLLKATRPFVDKWNICALHRYIRLEFSAADSLVTAVAVDGYRLSVEHCVCQCEKDFTAYIHGELHLPKNTEAELELENGELLIRCGDFILGTPQREGEFLDWRRVIPAGDLTLRFGVNGNYLIDALRAAKASAGNCFKNPLILEFRGPKEPMLIRTNKEDVKMVLPIRIREK